MKNENMIHLLSEAGTLSPIDIHFARFVTRLHGRPDDDVFLAAALVSRATTGGDVCLDLAAAAETQLVAAAPGRRGVTCPPLSGWRKKLVRSPAVGRPGRLCPLIIDDRDRLYLYRYWNYEHELAGAINRRMAQEVSGIDLKVLKDGLQKYFPPSGGHPVDWQKIACLCAVTRKLSVISGGPGTGKTFLIAGLLALILEQAGGESPNIFLAAPTGKAAARLKEALRSAAGRLACPDFVREKLPADTYTIHRLLGAIPDSPHFYYNQDHPLPADVLIVDEASMVDLALMAKLVLALSPDARLVLIGDMDQLASVSPGSAFGDICGRGGRHVFSAPFVRLAQKVGLQTGTAPPGDSAAPSGLQDCTVVLKKGYRFKKNSGIAALAEAVKKGDRPGAVDILKSGAFDELSWREIDSFESLKNGLASRVIQPYAAYLQTEDPAQAFRQFSRFAILCAARKGILGVEAVSRLVETILHQKGLIRPDAAAADPWYPGRPILITRNSYSLNLFNGDIGLTFSGKPADGDDPRVYFQNGEGELRRFSPYRLPENEPAYAMTVHKSQGSEFEHVLLILPEQDSPLLTRELLFTGVTRAGKSLEIWAREDILKLAVSRRIERASGLRDLLWGDTSA